MTNKELKAMESMEKRICNLEIVVNKLDNAVEILMTTPRTNQQEATTDPIYRPKESATYTECPQSPDGKHKWEAWEDISVYPIRHYLKCTICGKERT